MPQSVYIETTIVSYLAAWRSRDLIRAAQQQMTHEWWADQRSFFELYTSEIVVIEASAGDPAAAAERLKTLQPLPFLRLTNAALILADALISGAALPIVAHRDAQHIAIAAMNGLDFLLTWNCRHLANAVLRNRIEMVCESAGYRAPIICTPEELKGDVNG